MSRPFGGVHCPIDNDQGLASGRAIARRAFHETLPANGAVALLIILIGVALARRRPKREFISINKGV